MRRSFDNPNSIEARQALLDNRCERAHPKRHRTQKRAKRLSAQKRAAVKQRLAIMAAANRRYRARAHQYWAGESAEHPK